MLLIVSQEGEGEAFKLKKSNLSKKLTLKNVAPRCVECSLQNVFTDSWRTAILYLLQPAVPKAIAKNTCPNSKQALHLHGRGCKKKRPMIPMFR